MRVDGDKCDIFMCPKLALLLDWEPQKMVKGLRNFTEYKMKRVYESCLTSGWMEI